MVKGKMWIDERYGILYFTPLGAKQEDSWWLGEFEGMKQHLRKETVESLESEGIAYVDLEFVE